MWGKPHVWGDTTPRHEPGTGLDQSRDTPLGGYRATEPLGRWPGSPRATHETTPLEGREAGKSISTNGANRPTHRPRVRNVWRCHWLSKRRAKTKQITSQTWARLDVSGGGPLLWPASIPTDALHRISMTARSSRNCLQATGHAFHSLSWSEQGTRGWPNDSGRLQTGLFGVALPFKLQKKGDPARRPRDALRD